MGLLSLVEELVQQFIHVPGLCVRVCARACVRVCVHACVCVCVCV